MRAVGIIPARLHSSRLPRKLLLEAAGKPLIQYTWEAAQGAAALDQVLVATDSAEIARTVAAFDGLCRMTAEHPSGTDRIAQVVREHCPDVDLVVNIQGDEPEIDPAQIDQLVAALQTDTSSDMATLAAPIRTPGELNDPSCTKVVCDCAGRAMYFSRATIPHPRDADPGELLDGDSPWRLHLGIYAYRRDFLLQLTEQEPSTLERLEKLEQLRALETGAAIRVVEVEHRSVGIDTPEDYARFVSRVCAVDEAQRRAG